MKLFHSSLLMTALFAGQTFATPVGSGFTYQGKLNDGGAPANGNYDMIFNLYDAPTNGNVLGTFSIFAAVPVTNGLFTLELNAYNEFGADAFNGQARWLQIGVRTNNNNAANNFVYLNPRQALNCAPQAMFAQNASNAATVTDGAITGAKLAPGAVTWSSITGIPAGLADGVDDNTIYSAGPGLALNGANQFSASFGGSGSASTVARSDHQHYGTAWGGNTSFGVGLGVTNNSVNIAAGLYGQQGTGSGFPYIFGGITAGIWGESSQGSGVYGATAYTNGNGVFGFAVATTGENHGVQGVTLSTSGSGVFGSATATYGDTAGVSGQSVSGAGVGVRGLATSTYGPALGVRGETKSSTGYGVAGYASSLVGGASAAGVYGESSAANGAGLVGRSTSVNGQGPNYGVVGRSDASSGNGVYGYVGSSTGTNYGVVGRSDSLSGCGVYGHAALFAGTNCGVIGEAHSPASYGVVARNNQGVAFKAAGTGIIQSDADSYVWFPATTGFGIYSDAWGIWGTYIGLVNPGWTTDNYAIFPLTLPSTVYGQTTTLKSIEVFYKCTDSSTAYIASTQIMGMYGGAVLNDPVPRKSNVATSYTIPMNLSFANNGPLTLQINGTFNGNTHVYFYGVRARLGHN